MCFSACCLSKGSILYGFSQLFLYLLDYLQMLPEMLFNLWDSARDFINKLLK